MLTRVKFDSNKELFKEGVELREQDEFGITFGSHGTFRDLQYFINLYKDDFCFLNDSANDLSMYIMAYINDKNRACSFLDAVTPNIDKWKSQGVDITYFGDVECVKKIDKRLKIKRKKSEYLEIDDRFLRRKYNEKKL